MKLVLIPGLGYDHRIFKHLDVSNFDIEYLDWIEPDSKENLHSYSLRMFSKFKDTSEEIILLGHSLGGVVSQEIASAYPVKKVVLISSIKSREEMPYRFKLIKPFHIDKLFTKELSVRTVKYWGKNHGFETKEDQTLFKSMVSKQTNRYLQWALRALSSWHEPSISSQTEIIQIHGTHDKTFPIELIDNPTITIENGSHVFIYKQAKKTTDILHTLLN